MVEFVLVLPVMLLILLIAVDFGRLFFTYIAVNNAAREAANYAATHASDTPFVAADYVVGAQAAATGETNVQGQGGEGVMTVGAPICFQPGTPPTVINCDAASNFAGGIGNQVTVTVIQPFTFYTPIIGSIVGGELSLTASATAPVLNPLVAEFITTTTSTTTTSTTTTSTTTTSTTTTSTTTTSTTTRCVKPTVNISAAPTSGGKDVTVMDVAFTGTSTGSPTAWLWDFGDGQTATTAHSASHTYTYTKGNGNQKWTATLTVGTGPNCSDSDTVSITLNP